MSTSVVVYLRKLHHKSEKNELMDDEFETNTCTWVTSAT